MYIKDIYSKNVITRSDKYIINLLITHIVSVRYKFIGYRNKKKNIVFIRKIQFYYSIVI